MLVPVPAVTGKESETHPGHNTHTHAHARTHLHPEPRVKPVFMYVICGGKLDYLEEIHRDPGRPNSSQKEKKEARNQTLMILWLFMMAGTVTSFLAGIENLKKTKKKIAWKDLKYCGTDVTRTASLIHPTESAQFQSSKAVQFRCVKLRLHTAAVPACNVECSVDWNHQLVFGAIEDGWTHRKANHQTWGREIREGGGVTGQSGGFLQSWNLQSS